MITKILIQAHIIKLMRYDTISRYVKCYVILYANKILIVY